MIMCPALDSEQIKYCDHLIIVESDLILCTRTMYNPDKCDICDYIFKPNLSFSLSFTFDYKISNEHVLLSNFNHIIYFRTYFHSAYNPYYSVMILNRCSFDLDDCYLRINWLYLGKYLSKPK